MQIESQINLKFLPCFKKCTKLIHVRGWNDKHELKNDSSIGLCQGNIIKWIY